jgi:hypothetical protein
MVTLLQLNSMQDLRIWPLIIIIVGIVLLLNNFNIITPHLWQIIGKLWPAIFIYLGAEMLTRGRPRSRMLLMVILLAATVFLVLFLSEQT